MPAKIKLLYITTLPRAQWWFLRGQNKFLADRGFELYSITSKGKYFDELAKRDQMVMHPIDIPRSIVPHKDLAALIRIFFTIRNMRPDIVHASTPKAAFLGAAAAFAAGVPTRIFFMRGLTSDAKQGIAKKIFQTLEWATARFCNAHYCVSESLLKRVREVGILDNHEGCVLGRGMSNGVDCERFNPKNVARDFDLDSLREELHIPGNALVIGYVGRFTKAKGLCEISDAWKMLKAEFPDLFLLLVGEWGEEVDGVPDGIRSQLENDERVRVTGFVDNPAPYYALMTVLALPTHREGFPNVVMEGAAMALPVVATSVTGCVDAIIDGVTGTLIPVGSPHALATALKDYLLDVDLRTRHGVSARKRVTDHFRQEIVWNQIFEEYLRLTKG
jgi:glycosyltransferase involved in cell wall biosynthesis